MTPDDCEVVERYAAEAAAALGIGRPPVMYVTGADRVDIDMSSPYNDNDAIDKFMDCMVRELGRGGYLWDVWRLSAKFVSISEKEKGYE